jgi:hypothetical protein
MGGRPREALHAIDFGLISWSPLNALTPAASAYLLPRLMELAADPRETDRDGDPFMMRFINHVSVGPASNEFSLLEWTHREFVSRFLGHLSAEHLTIIEEACWEDTLAESLQTWSNPSLKRTPDGAA